MTLSLRITICAAMLLCAMASPGVEPPAAAPYAPASCHASIDSVKSRMSGRPLLPMEGVWEMTADGAVIAIERINDPRRGGTSAYALTAISMPDRSIEPGTRMGTAIDTADPRKLDAKIYTKSHDGELSAPADFVISLDGTGHRLSLSHYRQGIKVNLWRMIPYMFRYSVGKRDERPRGLDGMVRVYPPSSSSGPRYL